MGEREGVVGGVWARGCFSEDRRRRKEARAGGWEGAPRTHVSEGDLFHRTTVLGDARAEPMVADRFTGE